MIKKWLRKWLEIPLPAMPPPPTARQTINTGDAIQVIRDTTTAIVEKYAIPSIPLLVDMKLQETVRTELHNLMRESESIFVTRVAESLAQQVEELSRKKHDGA